jgi:hypothetical protein
MNDANIHMYRAEANDLRLLFVECVYTSVKDVIERDDDVEQEERKIRIRLFPSSFNNNKHLSTRAYSLIHSISPIELDSDKTRFRIFPSISILPI